MTDFKGKIAFITGSLSGGGLGQAQVFGEAGMKLVLADFSETNAGKVVDYFRKNGTPVHYIKLDVTNRDEYARAADETERVFGSPPDLLLLTAGNNAFGPVEAATFDDFDFVVDLCFGGVVNGLVTFVPRMIKAGKGGHIAATLSMGLFKTPPMVGPYSAAKAASLNLLECYKWALRDYDIGVSALLPALINSATLDGERLYRRGGGRPERYKNTGFYYSPDPEPESPEEETGMEPRVLAEWLKKGIEDNQFLIVPFKSATRIVQLHVQRLIDYTTPEGTRKVEAEYDAPMSEEWQRLNFEMDGYVRARGEVEGPDADPNIGKAAIGIDWVSPAKRSKPVHE